jgi:hypothetical protein
MTDQPRPQGQLDVQRWLGRCMLRLQQYERLMKLLLAHHELAGPADRLEAQRAANLEKVSDKTLGTLVKSLFESYAVPDGFERELLPEDKVPTDRISMAISYTCAHASASSMPGRGLESRLPCKNVHRNARAREVTKTLTRPCLEQIWSRWAVLRCLARCPRCTD